MMQAPVRQLRALLQGMVSDAELAALLDITLTDLSLDSRTCVAGCAFVAVPGLKSHGLQFADQAIKQGAVVVLWQSDESLAPQSDANALYVRIAQLSERLGDLANRFYGAPSQRLRIAAITGTNGKSTTAYLIAQAAEICALPAGYIGTVGSGRVGQLRATMHTTSDVLTVHRQLAQLVTAGAEVVAMEVSSHALHQARIAGVQIDTAVFTNLTQDHLDYHGSMQAYAEAKALLFVWPGLKHQVINADDEFGRELLLRAKGRRHIAYSCAQTSAEAPSLHAQVTLNDIGLQLDIDGDFGTATLHSALLGCFNAENLLAALAVLLGWQIPMVQAVAALSQCVAPPGRMELIHAHGKRAVIDYAHTPDALDKALRVLKLHCRGQLICVFGCGGDRDAGKRPLMGRVAAQWADQIILTDDNPRTENPDAIIAAIKSGMGDRACVIERNRAHAIAMALSLAQPQDIVLIAGKGHEDYQIIGVDTHPFSDREVVRAELRRAS
jgi:UDP-N-acetylmuramoyl-L-alanyl-D-glutamate--2,6-diaminopimelate ligase